MVKKKSVAKSVRKVVKRASSNKVDYYPNKMTLAVSVLAGTSLVLLGFLAAFTLSNGS